MKNNKKMTKLLSGMAILLLVLAAGLLNHEDTPTAGPPQHSQAASVNQPTRASEAATMPREGVEIQYTFRSEKLFNSHYEKHGAEFGDITKEEYLALANELIASPTALRKTEKEDGDAVIYEQADNMFLILATDGYIRTFFRPDDAMRYYERQ